MTNQDLAFDFMRELMEKYGEDIKITIVCTGEKLFEIHGYTNALASVFDQFDKDEIETLVSNFNYRHEHHNGFCYFEDFTEDEITFTISNITFNGDYKNESKD